MFVCGDVMTGRGIDQILKYHCDPRIYESYVKDARVYVSLAEKAFGKLPPNPGYDYCWGYALDEFRAIKPDLRLINLETSITSYEHHWPGKGIQYRMHPKNVEIFKCAGIDFCGLGNNHVLDWQYEGLRETLETLKAANIKYSGAGLNKTEAESPAILPHPRDQNKRVYAFSFGTESSGVPPILAAEDNRPGVNYIDLDNKAIEKIKNQVLAVKQKGDIAVASIHWGGNWGFKIPKEQLNFAHKLIDEAQVDLVYGHSSHHVKGIEVYKNKLILYGCGDFLDDYEGIEGYGEFRGDLGMMYFPTVDTNTGHLIQLLMSPTRVKNLRINKPSQTEVKWLSDTLNREGKQFGTRVELVEGDRLNLRWE
jgi:poly-gamma-glutamate synthesis protein (capsule biosynthesis protein)